MLLIFERRRTREEKEIVLRKKLKETWGKEALNCWILLQNRKIPQKQQKTRKKSKRKYSFNNSFVEKDYSSRFLSIKRLHYDFSYPFCSTSKKTWYSHDFFPKANILEQILNHPISLTSASLLSASAFSFIVNNNNLVKPSPNDRILVHKKHGASSHLPFNTQSTQNRHSSQSSTLLIPQ